MRRAGLTPVGLGVVRRYGSNRTRFGCRSRSFVSPGLTGHENRSRPDLVPPSTVGGTSGCCWGEDLTLRSRCEKGGRRERRWRGAWSWLWVTCLTCGVRSGAIRPLLRYASLDETGPPSVGPPLLLLKCLVTLGPCAVPGVILVVYWSLTGVRNEVRHSGRLIWSFPASERSTGLSVDRPSTTDLKSRLDPKVPFGPLKGGCSRSL